MVVIPRTDEFYHLPSYQLLIDISAGRQSIVQRPLIDYTKLSIFGQFCQYKQKYAEIAGVETQGVRLLKA